MRQDKHAQGKNKFAWAMVNTVYPEFKVNYLGTK